MQLFKSQFFMVLPIDLPIVLPIGIAIGYCLLVLPIGIASREELKT